MGGHLWHHSLPIALKRIIASSSTHDFANLAVGVFLLGNPSMMAIMIRTRRRLIADRA